MDITDDNIEWAALAPKCKYRKNPVGAGYVCQEQVDSIILGKKVSFPINYGPCDINTCWRKSKVTGGMDVS